MSSLYSRDVLRLAMQSAEVQPLPAPSACAELRSPTCGSRVRIDVLIGAEGRVSAAGGVVQACAFGQAAARIVVSALPGRSLDDVEAAASEMEGFLTGAHDRLPAWPGLEAIAAVRDHPGRHGAVLLPFRAALKALSPSGDD